MIPFNFSYYKPTTITDAISIYKELNAQGKNPLYYGGGTEFISMARMSNVSSEGVIDYKDIDECNVHTLQGHQLIIGSAVTLSKIVKSNQFPLLSQTVRRIADHTIQGKITLGGNLAGTIIYKESMLPLLITDSIIVTDGINGRTNRPIMKLLNNGNKLPKGELIMNVIVDQRFLNCPYVHVKRTKYEKIDYPLITMVGLKYNEHIRVAFSGLGKYPFRSLEIEEYLNDTSISTKNRIDKIIDNISVKITSDLSGTKEYRKFMLSTMLEELLEKFEKVS